VRVRPACRGLRAWRALKETHGTQEALKAPAALTTRAKREGPPNDKEGRLMAIRESDQLVVTRSKTEVWKRAKGLTW
jgi:hypothetical protein